MLFISVRSLRPADGLHAVDDEVMTMNLSELSDRDLCERFRTLAAGYHFTEDLPRMAFLHEIQPAGTQLGLLI